MLLSFRYYGSFCTLCETVINSGNDISKGVLSSGAKLLAVAVAPENLAPSITGKVYQTAHPLHFFVECNRFGL